MRLDPKFLINWKVYAIQCGFAALSVFIITFLLFRNPVVIASIGATFFIVFGMPNNISAQPKQITGGHLVGFSIGCCFSVFPFMSILFFKSLWFASSVGFCIFILVVLDFEHSPAVGTALGMTIEGYSDSSAFAIIISILILSFIGHFSKPFLKDLV